MRATAAILAICAGCATAGSPPPEPPPAEMKGSAPPCRWNDPPRVESRAGLSAKDLQRIRELVDETPERPIIRIDEWQGASSPPRRMPHAQLAIKITVLTNRSCDGTSGEDEEFYLEKTVDTWKVIAKEATSFIE
jgi:hypothetical protein